MVNQRLEVLTIYNIIKATSELLRAPKAAMNVRLYSRPSDQSGGRMDIRDDMVSGLPFYHSSNQTSWATSPLMTIIRVDIRSFINPQCVYAQHGAVVPTNTNPSKHPPPWRKKCGCKYGWMELKGPHACLCLQPVIFLSAPLRQRRHLFTAGVILIVPTSGILSKELH